jgi:hypothetical protein
MRARATFEMINPLLREEVTGYEIDATGTAVRPRSLLLPVPMVGLEAEM